MSRSNWLPQTRKIFWVIFLLTLPVTSFPYFPSGLGGSTLVRPLSLYPLLVLLLITVLPRLWKRPAPRTFLPFFAFLIIALCSTLIGLLRGIDPVIGVSVFDRAIRTLISLGLGGAFYLTVSLVPTKSEDLRFTLRWLYFGFGIALFWGSLQAIYVLKFHPAYFNLIKQLQRYISIRKLFPTRISGMTYEPNWFADQIAFLLMPWLFTAVFSGYSVFRWRWRWLTVEAVMLFWASGVLLFTYSRAGIVLLILQFFLIFLIRPKKQRNPRARLMSRWWGVGKRLLQAGMAMIVLFGFIYVAGSQNNYFSRLWNYWADDETGEYFQYVAFLPRFTYWETAYKIYEEYPLTGVGLGNFTFYFDEHLTAQQLYKTPELLVMLTPEGGRSQITTVKSIFPRILAETGLLGMAAFLSFLIAILGCAIYLVFSSKIDQQFWGRAGLFGMVVFLVISFSYDSFSLPNMWVVFGLITAAAQVNSSAKT